MADWVAARLETSVDTARLLVRAAKSLEEQPQLVRPGRAATACHLALFTCRHEPQAEEVSEEVGILRPVSRSTRWGSVLIAGLVGFGLGGCGETAPTASLAMADATTTPATTTATGPSAATTTTSTITTATTTTTAAPAAPLGQDLLVPLQPAPTIDGTLGPGEWDGAVRADMSDGTGLYVMHDGELLYLAIAGERLGAINVAIGGPEDTWILHSSAALGSIRYGTGGELSHDFDWCCRDADDSSGRLGLFDAEGWQANIGYAGEPGIVEYQVALPWVGAAMAVSAQTEVTEPAFSPAELPPEARAQLVGPWPSTRTFQQADWYTLVPVEE